MLQALQKFTRAVKRDYLPATSSEGSTFTFAKELKICAAMTWGMSLALLCAFPAICAWTPIFATGVSVFVFFERMREIRKEMHKKTTAQLATENGDTLCLSGPGRNVCLIQNTQKLVGKMTTGCETADELPPEIQAKLRPYINDGAEAALTLNATLQSQPQERIPYLRRVFTHAQEEAVTVAASVLTPFGVKRKQEAEYAAAVAATVEQCQSGLTDDVKVTRLRFKTPGGAA